MTTTTKELDTYTTDELLTEVLDRSAGDRPALDRISATTIQAVLNDCDEKADADKQPDTTLVGPPSIGQDDESL